MRIAVCPRSVRKQLRWPGFFCAHFLVDTPSQIRYNRGIHGADVLRREVTTKASQYIPTYKRNEIPKLKPRASLAALQWAAERANMSYGQFTQGLATDDEAKIQEEFEAWKAERSAFHSCVGIKDEMSTGGFIITDDDI